jgi:hypothetical protein
MKNEIIDSVLKESAIEPAMTLDQAIQIALKEVKDGYAQTYLRNIANAIEMSGTKGLKVQLLYALNNMKTWRGEQARQVKQVMKNYAK